MNKYRYAIIDQSFILQRNLFAITRRKKAGEYVDSDLIKSCLYTLNKISRDYEISADKFIFLMDKWDGSNGYITTQILKGGYKSQRGDISDETGKKTYMTEGKFEEIKNDPSILEEDKEKAYSQLYRHKVEISAKYKIAQELGNFGIPSFCVPGWEFDQLAYLSGKLLEGDNKPSILITQDSDLTYALTPNLDYFRIPSSKQIPKIIKYSDMEIKIPEDLRDRISLFQYGAYLNALGVSHNGMKKTKKMFSKTSQVINKVLNGDYSSVEDVDLFKLQLSTYDISKYPRYEEAKDIILNLFPKFGKVGSYIDWLRFCEKLNIRGLSMDFYTSLVSNFNIELYEHNN